MNFYLPFEDDETTEERLPVFFTIIIGLAAFINIRNFIVTKKLFSFVCLIATAYLATGPIGQEKRVKITYTKKGQSLEAVCESDLLDRFKTMRGQNFYQYKSIIKKYSDLYKVDSDLIFAMAIVESHLDPEAVSPVGAKGLLQIMPRTQRYLYKELSIEKHNLDSHIHAAVHYYNYLEKRFVNRSSPLGKYGPKGLAIMSYNMGPTYVSRRIKEIEPIEGHRYVDKVNLYHQFVTGTFF